MPDSISIKRVSPHEPSVLSMIEQLNAHNRSHYSAEFCHPDPPEVLARENCTMLGAYSGGELVGIGAVKLFEGYGEIKRMFVPPQFRGRGIATLVLKELIAVLVDGHVPFARLETGAKFFWAIQLYSKNGFVRCNPFGDYRETPNNVFMDRKINAPLLGPEQAKVR